jgi:hypothetical protein
VVTAAGCEVVVGAIEVDCAKGFGALVLAEVDCPNKVAPLDAGLDWKPEPEVGAVVVD